MARRSSGELWALVLAGGDGTRLRELTRAIAGAPIPKQYCRITGDRSLLEATLARVASLVPTDRTLVIVNRDHLEVAAGQLRGIPPANLVVQPRNLDTGPGVLLSLLHLARRSPEARLAVFPSDHYVGNEGAFLAHVERAVGLVEAMPGKITLLGIRPDRPDPEYGYIEPAEPVLAAGGAHRVAAFREKPSAEEAEVLVRRGGLWNSFVMTFASARMLDLLREARPADVRRLGACRADAARLARVYRSLPAWNLSRDFLARVARHLLVVRAEDTEWSDWGTPQAIERTLAILRIAPPWRASRVAAASA